MSIAFLSVFGGLCFVSGGDVAVFVAVFIGVSVEVGVVVMSLLEGEANALKRLKKVSESKGERDERDE
jgi:hypothetical protein